MTLAAKLAPGALLRRRLTVPQRHPIAMARLRLRQPTAKARALPDFLVIGAVRSGTSTLYKHLSNHPDVFPSLRKETRFFTREYAEGMDWYRAHFPLRARLAVHERVRGHRGQCFEASPGYFFHPDALSRIEASLPQARFVVLLRDPIERVWSLYRHRVRVGLEHRPLEELIRPGPATLGEADEHEAADGRADRVDGGVDQTLSKTYAASMQRWIQAVGRGRIHIVASERYFSHPDECCSEIFRHLGLRAWQLPPLRNHSYADDAKAAEVRTESIPRDARDVLTSYFQPHNAALRALLPDVEIPWLE